MIKVLLKSQCDHHDSFPAFHPQSWLFHGITFELYLIIHGNFHNIRIIDSYPW